MSGTDYDVEALQILRAVRQTVAERESAYSSAASIIASDAIATVAAKLRQRDEARLADAMNIAKIAGAMRQHLVGDIQFWRDHTGCPDACCARDPNDDRSCLFWSACKLLAAIEGRTADEVWPDA